MTDQVDDGGLLTAEQVATRLRIKPATVYQAASEGRLPHVRLWKGTRRALIRFKPEDINRLIDDRTVPAINSQADS